MTVDILRPGSDLDGYEMIVVPSLFHVSDEVAQGLAEAAERGATIVIDHFSGIVDNDGFAHLGGYLGPLAGLVGARVLEVSPLAVAPQGGASQLVESPGGVRDQSADDVAVSPISATVSVPGADPRVRLDSEISGMSMGRDWSELLDVRGADVVATFADGDLAGYAAVVRNSVGQGTAWYSATRLDAASRQGLLGHLAGIDAVTVPDALPTGIERVRRGDVEFFLNHSNEMRTVKASGQDLLTGRAITGAVEVPARTGAVIQN